MGLRPQAKAFQVGFTGRPLLFIGQPRLFVDEPRLFVADNTSFVVQPLPFIAERQQFVGQLPRALVEKLLSLSEPQPWVVAEALPFELLAARRARGDERNLPVGGSSART